LNYLLGPTHRMLSCGIVSPTSLRMIRSRSVSTSVSTKKFLERYENIFHNCNPYKGQYCVCRIAGNFRGVQFLQMANLQTLIFADACNHAHYIPYNCTYFAGLIFADSRLSVKTAKNLDPTIISRYTVCLGTMYIHVSLYFS
jgi:hypothetical protein